MNGSLGGVLIFPDFDPVATPDWFPIPIRWYALAYIVGLILGWQLVRRLIRWTPATGTPEQVDDFLTWATLGVVLGGRLGYVLFYQPAKFLADPALIPRIWTGGMSFHGGALGVIIAAILFCRRHKLPFFGFADRVAVAVPLGLGLGRVANFINGELWGRVAPADLPWAMVFPRVDMLPRHPSQIYQALMEGLILFVVMMLLARRESIRARFGTLSGCFLIGYGIARGIGEMFRQPDAFLGFLWGGATMGQLLCIPMVIAGAWMILRARRQPAAVMSGA